MNTKLVFGKATIPDTNAQDYIRQNMDDLVAKFLESGGSVTTLEPEKNDKQDLRTKYARLGVGLKSIPTKPSMLLSVRALLSRKGG